VDWFAPGTLRKGKEVVFAINLKESGELIGAIGMALKLDQELAELGYWIGKPYWSRGYCTEAARVVLHFVFTELHLNRVYAHHFSHNPASGRVMQKIGMHHEGRLRQHVKKWENSSTAKPTGSYVRSSPILDAISVLNARDDHVSRRGDANYGFQQWFK